MTHALKYYLSLQHLCCHLHSCHPSLEGLSFLALLQKLAVICLGQTHFTKKFIKWLLLYKLSWIKFSKVITNIYGGTKGLINVDMNQRNARREWKQEKEKGKVREKRKLQKETRKRGKKKKVNNRETFFIPNHKLYRGVLSYKKKNTRFLVLNFLCLDCHFLFISVVPKANCQPKMYPWTTAINNCFSNFDQINCYI